jgi:hypothetical protein
MPTFWFASTLSYRYGIAIVLVWLINRAVTYCELQVDEGLVPKEMDFSAVGEFFSILILVEPPLCL